MLKLLNNKGILVYREELEPYLERCCKYSDGQFTPDYVIDNSLDGSFQIWILEEELYKVKGVAVTQLMDFAQQRTVFLLLSSADKLYMWSNENIGEIEKWAKLHEANEIVVIGRKGLARTLNKIGFKTDNSVIMKKTINR